LTAARRPPSVWTTSTVSSVPVESAGASVVPASVSVASSTPSIVSSVVAPSSPLLLEQALDHLFFSLRIAVGPDDERRLNVVRR
jgi:hypothetical protein